MGWEYRISKEIRTHKYLNYDPKTVYGIKEVFIDENGEISYIPSMPLFMSESIEQLKLDIQNMLEAYDKPIIDNYYGEEP